MFISYGLKVVASSAIESAIERHMEAIFQVLDRLPESERRSECALIVWYLFAFTVVFYFFLHQFHKVKEDCIHFIPSQNIV